MILVSIEGPAEIVLLDDVKRHLRVDHDDDDLDIASKLDAAIGAIDGPDGWLGRSLGVRTLELRTDRFDQDCGFDLVLPPVREIVSITYADSSGVDQVLASSAYRTIGPPLAPCVVSAYGQTWPVSRRDGEAVRIRYTAGYDVASLPPQIRAAILLMVGDLYENREAKVLNTLFENPTVEALLGPLRIFR